ncbi:MAG: DNA repair protein RecN [Lachnospiraceae bacterium]|nr:DNA repair protein RecN [Lachnospiraceae bacterium]
MLQSIHVKNIALIDDVEIELTDGLNILTGETGAGKSIIIDAVNFALGSRMQMDMVRDEMQPAVSELVFDVRNKDTLAALAELDVMLTDNQVILKRRIVGGKSVCKVNDETVTASRIRQIAELLIDIHGQHEHQSLLYRKNHRAMLDSFCKDELETKLCKLKEAYDSYKKIKTEYEDAVQSADSAASELDYARFVVNEIEKADIKDGEDIAVEDDFRRMNNARRIMEMINGVAGALSSDAGGASAMISSALSYMKQVADLDDMASPIYEQLSELDDLLSDCIRSVDSYAGSLDFSEEDHERVRVRLDTINAMKMKYGQTTEEIGRRLEEESAKIARLSDYETYLNSLSSGMNEKHELVLKLCRQISDIRKKEALVLQKEIEDALGDLNFLDARFEIDVRSDEEKITSDGFDDVEFMISTNPGEDLKGLADVASGGELSRIMLALKSVLATRDNIETLIFDEIDSGISGRTAQLVADRMTQIAKDHQVIAITHLPQIASHARSHFLIEKTATDSHTSTNITPLSYEDSVEEIARMLAGADITDAVRKNAEELKAGNS